MLVQIELSPTSRKNAKLLQKRQSGYLVIAHRCIHWLSLEHQGLLYIELMAPELCDNSINCSMMPEVVSTNHDNQLVKRCFKAPFPCRRGIAFGWVWAHTSQNITTQLKWFEVWRCLTSNDFSCTFLQWFEDVWSLQQLQSLTASACGSLMAPPAHACVISKLC